MTAHMKIRDLCVAVSVGSVSIRVEHNHWEFLVFISLINQLSHAAARMNAKAVDM